MKNHDDVIPFLDSVTQASLLVAAIAEVARIPVHVEIRDMVQEFVSHPGPIGIVIAGVVHDVDLRSLLFERSRDSLVRRDERAYHVIGHDKNAEAFHTCHVLTSVERRLQRAWGWSLEEHLKLRLPLLNGHEAPRGEALRCCYPMWTLSTVPRRWGKELEFAQCHPPTFQEALLIGRV